MAEIYDFEPPKISGVSSFLNTVRVNFIHLCDRNRMIEEKNMNMTSRLPVLASTLGTLFTVCLALTLLGVGHYGLDTPLTHTLAGMTAIFFTLFLLSERFNPNPLLPRTSRHSSAFMIRLCTSAFGAVVCLPAFLLMLWLMKNAYGFGSLNLLMAGIPVLLDLTSAEGEVAKRVLDFSTGVVFGLASGMHRVDRNVFLLSPAGMEVEGVTAAGVPGA